MGVWSESGQICLSVNGSTVAEVLRVMDQHGHDADLVEIRLDLLDEPAIEPFIDAMASPLLFTNRPEWEGGAWRGAEEERVALLVEAIELGATYVDIEFKAPSDSFDKISSAAKRTGCKTILSWHNFKQTPPEEELVALVQQMAKSGADLGKIVTTAHDYADVLRVLSLQLVAQDLHFPLACFAMGKPGQVSRAATLHLGGLLTYGAADAKSCTAPGQLTVAQLRRVQEVLG